tara:strand:+ start:2530 stop:2841 length:312 start_codon:yes stop_codon:yes gene_type:complete
MIGFEILQIIGLGFLILWSLIATYYCIKFARALLKTTESIEVALDIFDTRYASISKILQIPLFYDSHEVRQVLTDIEQCRDAILQVADIVGKIEQIEEADGES